jgi:signal transduction histidine kinase
MPLVRVLLVSTLAAACGLAIWLGDDHITAVAILLAAAVASWRGLPAVMLITPLALLPLYIVLRPLRSWETSWELAVAIVVGLLVADLRKRNRRAQSRLQSARTAVQDMKLALQRSRIRLDRYRARLQRAGNYSSLARRRARLLTDAPLRWLEEADYASVYERIAHTALGVLGDACRVDLWEIDGRPADRFWSAALEPRPELESFLNERRAIDRLPELRQVLRQRRARVIEPVSPHTWAALTRQPAGSLRERSAALLLVPIVINGRVKATLTLYRRGMLRCYSADTVARAEEFARRSATAIMQFLRLEHLMAARHRAEQAEQEKAEALAGFSHDMRTPLQAVNGYTQLLLEQIAGPLTDKQQEYLQRIQQAQDRLNGLVDRVLTLARLDNEQRSAGPRVVELSAVAREIAALFAVECQHKSLRIELPDSRERILVWADPEKVWRVMQNLISNAIKYTHSGGRIALTFERAHERVEVRVSDNGKGVPNQELDAIFQPFYQVDPHTEGAGLGLAISRTLAHEMGGDLEVASEPGRGSTFTLRLPRSDEGSESEPSRTQAMLMASAV